MQKDTISIVERKIHDVHFIAVERNKILINKYGKLPSYCLWDSDSVSEETPEERLEWFKEFEEIIRYFSPFSQRIIGESANNP